MPQGKGTYGSKVGRPSEKKKDVTKVKKAASKGKITSKEAGASRIANRKKAASNPLASMKKKK